MSTQALQPLIWLARRCTSSSSLSGRPLLRQRAQRLQRLHGVGNNHRRVVHSRLHHLTLHVVSSGFDEARPICCHIGLVSFVIAMTEREKGM